MFIYQITTQRMVIGIDIIQIFLNRHTATATTDIDTIATTIILIYE